MKSLLVLLSLGLGLFVQATPTPQEGVDVCRL
jgi:hypothetical protein